MTLVPDTSTAAMLSAALGQNVVAVDGGFRVKETETHWIDVQRMIFNWRLSTTPKHSPLTYDRNGATSEPAWKHCCGRLAPPLSGMVPTTPSRPAGIRTFRPERYGSLTNPECTARPLRRQGIRDRAVP